MALAWQANHHVAAPLRHAQVWCHIRFTDGPSHRHGDGTHASATPSCVGPWGLESFWATLSARQGRGGSSEAIYQAFTAIDSGQSCIASN